MKDLVERVLRRDVRAAGRLMRLVDDDMDQARAHLARLFPHTGQAFIVGVTGNPGAGKSTLVNQMIHEVRGRGLSVGCIAVDPTSPFSGGAILGDRIRMQAHSLDPDVYIRSVATRGNLGGISRSTPAIVQVMDAMGYELILVETVGVGQDEVDIVRLADTSVVVTVPGLGDEVQASKAGIMEIADIFVINKADRDGAKRLRRELRTMTGLVEAGPDDWTPPIVETVATQNQGTPELWDQIFAHRSWLKAHGQAKTRERERLNHYVQLLALGRFSAHLKALFAAPEWEQKLDEVQARVSTPYDLATEALERL